VLIANAHAVLNYAPVITVSALPHVANSANLVSHAIVREKAANVQVLLKDRSLKIVANVETVRLESSVVAHAVTND